MAVKLKLFLFLLFLINPQFSAIIKRTKQNQKERDRVLKLLPMKLKRQIKRKLKFCEQDADCIKYTLQDALKKIKHTPSHDRKLRIDSSHTMQLLIVMILIYLMFTQPILAGILLFLGGINGFAHFLRRERRLNKINPQVLKTVENYSSSKVRNMYQSEKRKLFHYFQNNPVKFKTINEERLVNLTVDYFDQVYNKHSEKLNNKITRNAKMIFRNKKFIEKEFLKPKQFQSNYQKINLKNYQIINKK